MENFKLRGWGWGRRKSREKNLKALPQEKINFKRPSTEKIIFKGHSRRKNKFIFNFSSGPLPRSLMTDKCESAYVNVQYTLRRNWLTGLQSSNSMLCLSKKHMFNFPLKLIVKDCQSPLILIVDWLKKSCYCHNDWPFVWPMIRNTNT